MGNDFFQISTPDELALFFGLSYEELARVIYGMPPQYRYSEFQLRKRAGGYRTIKVPCRRLKSIQRRLKDELYDIHEPRASAHGFVRGRSVATNARRHSRRSYVFNLDLEGYFDSIHRGRVRGLFAAAPFNFPSNVATVLMQICCLDDALPQGAPTSPIVANMITRKLDRQLEGLARASKATYTRYADDLTFSFNCSRSHLPRAIVDASDGAAVPGPVLVRLIEENGFAINHDKVRLAGSSQRKAVTGVTVNEFPNVPRKYVRQIRSQLHAWQVFGYEAAEREFNDRYDSRHRATDQPKSLMALILGKMAYLKSIRGGDDSVYLRLAEQYNELIGDNGPRLMVPLHADPVQPIGQGDDDRGLIVKPGQKYDNRLLVYQLVRGATSYLFWYERHMGRKALELLRGELPKAARVKLLSGPVKAEQLTQLKDDFRAFEHQMRVHHDIEAEWRVLDGTTALPHARLMLTDAGAWNMPPLNTILKGDVDEALVSKLGVGDFEEWWSQGIALKDCSAGGRGVAEAREDPA